MLKRSYRLWLVMSGMLLIVGVVLSVMGLSLQKDLSYLREDGKHKWYQLISIDDQDHFHLGIYFDDQFMLGSIGITND